MQLESAILKAPTTGRTALYDAVAEALERLLDGHREKKVLVAISDGGDNASTHSLAEVLKLAEQSSALVYTIGIFDPADEDRNPDVLRRLARATGGEAFFPGQFNEVVAICERIARDIRNQYTLGYVSATTGQPGVYRTIRVAASVPGTVSSGARAFRLHRGRGREMRVFVAKQPLERLLRWTQRTFLVFGLSVIAYCGYVLIDTWNFQRTEQRQFEDLLVDRISTHSTGGKARQTRGTAGDSAANRRRRSDRPHRNSAPRPFGDRHGGDPAEPPFAARLAISPARPCRATGERRYFRAPRPRFFRPLRNIRQNDTVTLTTLAGEYRYRVVGTMIVGPNDVAVLDPAETKPSLS